MRHRIVSRLLAAAALVFGVLFLGTGSGAWAKTKPPARAHVPVPSVVTGDGLRGAVPAPVVSLAPAPLPPPPSLALPRESALTRLGGPGTGLASAVGAGLRAKTDPAPLCRSSCAQARYRCLANDQSEGCDGNWTRCVLACREPLRP